MVIQEVMTSMEIPEVLAGMEIPERLCRAWRSKRGSGDHGDPRQVLVSMEVPEKYWLAWRSQRGIGDPGDPREVLAGMEMPEVVASMEISGSGNYTQHHTAITRIISASRWAATRGI